MSNRVQRSLGSIALCVVGALAMPSASMGQAAARTHTDSRWIAWLGCWSASPAADSAHERSVAANATCVIPIAGSTAVEALTIARGKIVSRDALDANLSSHAVKGQGCQGAENVNWSSTGRRVYLRSDYTCAGGTKGASSTIYAISTAGDWLFVQAVRSGGGVVSTVDRRHSVELSSAVPAAAAQAIDAQQLAIRTARANAAAAITSAEIVDAVHDVDASAVRSWVLASDQSFDVDGTELASLARADVPQSVLQAIMATTSRATAGPDAAAHDVDEYLNRPGYAPSYPPSSIAGTNYPTMTTMYVCPPAGCYSGNEYSPYNGYAPAPYYPYGGYVPYPLIYPGGFITTHSGETRPGRGAFREPARMAPHSPIHEPPHAKPPTLPGPTGKRP